MASYTSTGADTLSQDSIDSSDITEVIPVSGRARQHLNINDFYPDPVETQVHYVKDDITQPLPIVPAIHQEPLLYKRHYDADGYRYNAATSRNLFELSWHDTLHVPKALRVLVFLPALMILFTLFMTTLLTVGAIHLADFHDGLVGQSGQNFSMIKLGISVVLNLLALRGAWRAVHRGRLKPVDILALVGAVLILPVTL